MKLPDSKQLTEIIWVCLIALYVNGGMNLVPLYGDETILPLMGRDYFYHFIERDFSKLTYDEGKAADNREQRLRIVNGTISKYIFGWLTYINGYSTDDVSKTWSWDLNYQQNLEDGRIPDPRLLKALRYASALQLVGAVCLYFVIVRNIMNRPTTYISSLYLTLHPSVLIDGQRAMMEGSHLLFMMLAILAAVWLIRDRKNVQFVLFGLASGFAVAAKHPNVIIVALLFFAVGSYVVTEWMRQQVNFATVRNIMGKLILSGLLCLVTFYALNPAWWQKPVQVAQHVIGMRTELIDRQTKTFEDAGLVYHSVTDKLENFFEIIFVTEIDPFIRLHPDNVKLYEESFWGGIPIGGSTLGGLIVAGLCTFGFIHLWHNPQILLVHRWVLYLWSLGIIAFTVATIPFRIVRYYIPVAPRSWHFLRL